MFRRFPVFERLITWTKPDAPFERDPREYEWYDHNSLLAEEPECRALVPGLMDRTFDVPSRDEMEAGLVAFAERTGLEIRYGCRWESTRREDDGLVLVTSDGEYRCRAAVFAIGVTEPWKAPIPGVEHASHYVDTGDPSGTRAARSSSSASATRASRSRAGCSPGRRRSCSPRRGRSRCAILGALGPCASATCSRSTSTRGAVRGAYVVDAAIERIERTGERLPDRHARDDVARELFFEVDDVLVATGFRTPLLRPARRSGSRRSRTAGSRR